MGSTPLTWLHISQEVEEHLLSASLTLPHVAEATWPAQEVPEAQCTEAPTHPTASPPNSPTMLPTSPGDSTCSPRGGTEPFLLAPSPLSQAPCHHTFMEHSGQSAWRCSKAKEQPAEGCGINHTSLSLTEPVVLQERLLHKICTADTHETPRSIY